MSSADDFLLTWSMAREHTGPMSRNEAELVAGRWEQAAVDNGVSPVALRRAAGGDIADYLLRTYGEKGDEIEM